jgi:cysteine-S-conjugate beta-lyase
MSYDFNQVIDRFSSDSVKWNYFDPDVLPMWVADLDFRSPEPVIQALHERIDHGVFGYTEFSTRRTQLMRELHDIIVERMLRLYDWKIQPEDIVFLPGVVSGFNLACHTLLCPDESVFIQTPVYPPILRAAKETGFSSQEMELTREPDGSYTVDWDLFDRSLTSQTRLFLLCNPHNPVGKVFNETELLHMANACLRRGIYICSDEIHCDLIFSGQQHRPIASLAPEIGQNSITLMAPSKTYNLAGLHCSLAIIQNPALRKKYEQSTKGLLSDVNLLGLHAALAAFKEGQDWLTELLAYLEGNRDYLLEYVNSNIPTIKVWKPQGTYLAWLDCRQAGVGLNPSNHFLEVGRVGFNDGASFGKGGEGFVRFNFGCPRKLLTEGLERMKNSLNPG